MREFPDVFFFRDVLDVFCPDRIDSIHLFAAGALPDGDVSELREHLSTGCPACITELAGASAVAALLPLSLDPVNPPAGLKDRLMRRIDDELATPPIRLAGQPAVDSIGARIFRLFVPAAVAAGITLVATHFYMNRLVVDARSQAAVYQERATRALTVAATLNEKLQAAEQNAESQNHLVVQLTTEKKAGDTQLADARHQLDDLKTRYASQSAVVDMLESHDVRLVDLTPTDLQKGAVAHLVWDETHRKWAVLVAGMTPAKAGQTYELWFVTTAGAKIRAGIFDVDRAGAASVLVDVPADLGPLKLVAVTNEKTGGEDQPHGDFQLTGNL